MQKYLVRQEHKGVGLSKHKEEHLVQMHQGLTEALSRGRIEAAWSTAGGGSVFIVNAEHHGDLMRALHKVNAHGVDVTPVVDTLDVIEEHILHRRSQEGGEPAPARGSEEEERQEERREGGLFRLLRHQIRRRQSRGEDTRELIDQYRETERRRREGEDVLGRLRELTDSLR